MSVRREKVSVKKVMYKTNHVIPNLFQHPTGQATMQVYTIQMESMVQT
ncbi:hypothetical protein [Mucilaginibacter sp. OK098]|nr:hypothetical protein [Mucilaginibacter sp. OK098]